VFLLMWNMWSLGSMRQGMGLCVCWCACVCVWCVSHQCSNYFIRVLIMHCYPIMFFKVLYWNRGNMFCLMYDVRGLRYWQTLFLSSYKRNFHKTVLHCIKVLCRTIYHYYGNIAVFLGLDSVLDASDFLYFKNGKCHLCFKTLLILFFKQNYI